MSTILKQRKFLTTKVFEITDKSLTTKVKKPMGYFENEFTFEEIGNKITRQRTTNNLLPIASLIPITASLVFFILYCNSNNETFLNVFIACFSISGLIGLVVTISSHNEVLLYLHDKRFISFYTNSPSEMEVTAFVYLIKKEQKKYLLERYAKNDPYWSVEQKSRNLDWLRDRDIINSDELNELRLQNLPRPGVTAIGFKS